MRSAPRAARIARLVYRHDDEPGYRRAGRNGAFHYLDAEGRRIRREPVLRRIRQLVIPPAWTRVWINPHARGHLQASGRDARGRKQYVYHEDWRASRDAAKFHQLPAFACALPRLRRAVRADLRRPRLDRLRVTAVVLRLLETSLIRIGNQEYARTNGSYGLTTMRARHAHVARGAVAFTFRGKSGTHHRITVSSRTLARVVRCLQDLPGQDLFVYLDDGGARHRLRSDDVNTYLRENMGANFTAKDFRTWAGTVLAALALAQVEPPRTKAETKRTVAAGVRTVASRLGNTPAIARQSYIHPIVISAFTAGRLPNLPTPDRWPSATLPRGLTRTERAVLRVLESRRTRKSPT